MAPTNTDWKLILGAARKGNPAPAALGPGGAASGGGQGAPGVSASLCQAGGGEARSSAGESPSIQVGGPKPPLPGLPGNIHSVWLLGHASPWRWLRAAQSEYLKSKRAQRPGVGKRPLGAPRSPLLPSPLPLTVPFTEHRALIPWPASKVNPAPQRALGPWAWRAKGGGERDSGPRAGGRDGTRCSVVLSPANIALVPASGLLGPPASPSP